ncbi:MAG: serine hydrolase [Variibacter sp.]|nr:serine hydrolase [Variibacter sp.]
MNAILDRRQVVLGAGAALIAQSAALSAEWQSTTLAEADFDARLPEQLDDWVTSGRAANVHGVVIIRRGRLVLERYYTGEDQVRTNGGLEHTQVTFGPDHRHELRSVTKSLVGLIYGIALAQGKVPPIDQPLLAQFPQYTDLPDMAQRRRWTIAHALTMTLGIAWDESISYTDPRNGQTAMEAAPDRYRYVLERPIVAAAGERWIYCGGATALIGKIIENGTRQPIPDYARTALFEPLGIGPTEWRSGRDGERNFASGLGMRPRELARLGQMLLDNGRAGERQIVPAAWLAESLEPAVRIDARRQYGRHWYLGGSSLTASADRRSERWVAAMGNGGQRLAVFPALDLVVVVTAGNYNRNNRASDHVITEVVLPSLR